MPQEIIDQFRRDVYKGNWPMTEIAALKTAVAAGITRANEVWELHGKVDRGSCGGAMLEFDRRSKLFKVAKESGVIDFCDAFVNLKLPEGVRTQAADIYQGQMYAFRDSLIASGYGKAIKRFWTYID